MNFDTGVANNNPDTFVYLSAPQMDELCCVICETDSIETRNSATNSEFHWQIIKCRLLVHMVPEVIASPVLGTRGYIFVVAGKKYFASGKLHLALKNLKLLFVGLRPLTTDIYRVSLVHAVRYKIAPLWNQVGQYYVEGKESYKSSEEVQALKFTILINGKSTRLQMRAGQVRMQCLKLEDFCIPQICMAKFLADSKGRIDLTKYVAANVHVLPSMRKGKAISVSKQIPARCPFKDYDQLRRHWKNMYGYSLPKDSDGILFYEIKFAVSDPDIFTYPDLCLVSQSVQLSQNWNAKSTIERFLSDMRKTVISICGTELQTSDEQFLNTKTPDKRVRYQTRLSLSPLVDRHLSTPSVDSGHKTEKAANSSTNAATGDKRRNDPVSSVEPSSSTRSVKLDEIHGSAATVSIVANCTVTSQAQRPNCQTITKSLKRKSVTMGEQQISSYFKVKKVCTTVSQEKGKDVNMEKKSQKNLSLREKLENGKNGGMTNDGS